MAERIEPLTDDDRVTLRQSALRSYVPAFGVLTAVLVLSWAFGWLVLGTSWFGAIATVMVGGVFLFLINKIGVIWRDFRDGRKRMVVGEVSALGISENGAPLSFEIDYEKRTLRTSFKSRRLTESSLEDFDSIPTGGDSRTYMLLVDGKEYKVSRSCFFRHPVGASFEGSFTMSGRLIEKT